MDTIRKAYISMLTESTDDSIKQLEAELLEKHPQLHSLSLYKSGNNVKLDTIIVKKEHRKSGVGSAVLDDIKQYADKNSKRVILTAGVKDKHWGTTSQSRLDQFYRRNGFVANKGRNKDYSISATHYYDGKPQLKESTEHPMIMLDGIPRHMNNSEGKPIHPTQEGIYNFHRWFGKSKAVDEHGRPQVFYHGTGKDFDHFSHDFTGSGIDAHGSGFYFAKNPDMANTYATSHVLPVYLKLTKPIDRTSEKELSRTHIQKMIVSAPDHVESLENFGDVARSYNRVLSDAVDAYSGSSKFESMSMLHNDFYGNDHKKFLENFKKHTGHDGVMVKDENIATVFHPSQIKSAIGNDGTFDHPTKITESIEHPMIDVDGELKHRHNSLGQPIHHTDEGIRNFHRWFGDSNSVDEHGRPKVFYHGTGSDVDNFDQSKIGFNNRFGPGFYFTDDKKTFDSYSTSIGGNVLPVYLKTKHTNFDDHLTHDQIDKFHSVLRDKKFPNGYDATKDHETIKDQLKQNNAHALSKLFSNSSLYFSKDDWFRGMKALNIDSIHRKMFGGNEVVVHSPNQIKSAIGNDGTFDHPTKITEAYHGEHSAPDPDTGAPAHNLTDNGIYPEDVYSWDAARLYGDGRSDDASVISDLKSLRGRPKTQVKVYRAIPHEKSNSEKIEEFESHKRHIMRTGKIPSGVSGFTNSSKYYEHASSEIDRLKSLPEQSKEKIKINPGDWVTTNLRYAHEHGRDNLNNKYKIISKTVSASSIYTDGNSLHEFGYHPKNKLKEENVNHYTPKDSAMAAYKQVVSEASNDENLSNIWKTTANQPWHEYMKTVKGVSHAIKQQQGEDSVENDASKKRVNDYLTKYKHLF